MEGNAMVLVIFEHTSRCSFNGDKPSTRRGVAFRRELTLAPAKS